MESQNSNLLINNEVNVNRDTAFDALPSEIKEYSKRVAYNTKLIFEEYVKKNQQDEDSDINFINPDYVYEAVKYFDIGYAFKDEKTLFPDKILPIFHVKKGADVFFSDIKKREDFKSLSDKEKTVRRIAKEVAYYHHERWDGRGYPEGLRKEEIPLIARICSICLAYESITYDAATDTSRPRNEALEFLTKEAGKSYDPALVFIAIDITDKLVVQGDIIIPVEVEHELTITEEVKQDKESTKTETLVESEEQENPNEHDKADFVDVTEENAAIDLNDADPIVEIKEKEKIENPNAKKAKKVSRHIEMFFMPVYDMKTESIVYYQSKLVLNDKKLGAMMPAIYSTMAEKSGKIAQIVEIGLDQVIQFIKLADILEYKVEAVSVRLYTKIVERQSVFNKIINQIKKSGIEPSRFILEIPETALASANEKLLETLRKIKDMGIKIAMAEFGFAYSSLHKLADIEFDILKISREYILDVDSNSRSVGIVRSIIDMVKTLGAEEVCEGVDSEDQKHALQKIGCRKIQGTIVGEPKTSKDLLGF